MKTHTSGFKNEIVNLGRELRGVITYNNITLEDEIYSITPHYETSILKSVMKQLDLELSVNIPLNTVINCQIGIKVNGSFEMLNYGNYVVYKSEKQEDKRTYKITCYDKMLYAMKQNESLNVQYPISIKNYLIALLNKIGLTLATNTFYNESLEIPSELYLGLDYTYRDILDEIAQATGSIICLNENDEIIVKYPTQTNDTINEEFLKDVNVNFAERYGAINAIVLSRSGESDNVYYPSPLPQNPVEIKIVDNQIMNFNNRSDFLEGIYNALNGLYYYINDFESTGILYYEVGDLYNIQVGENTYQCLMLNDEVNITTGIKELIHTDMPEQSETDYTKADKTDMRINQTYRIVDKQNQVIEAVITNVSKQNKKISQITQTVDDLTAQIQDIADITTYGESDRAEVELEDVNESEPIMIKVHPTSTNISYLYPRNDLYPSNDLFMPDRVIQFKRTYYDGGTTKTEYIYYTLPDDLLRYSDTVYDEFYLNYESQTCQVIKRCAYNADGTVRALDNEITTDYTYPTILLGEGNYEITLHGYNFGYLYVRLMAKNIYTTQFYTKVETDSRINQKANEINLGVNQTLTNYSTTTQMNSAINLKANEINSVVSTKVGNNEVISKINQSSEEVTIDAEKVSLNGKEINLTSDNVSIISEALQIDNNGNITMTGAENSSLFKMILNNDNNRQVLIRPNSILLKNDTRRHEVFIANNLNGAWIQVNSGSARIEMYNNASYGITRITVSDGFNETQINPTGITTPTVTQTSLETQKKNFEKLQSGLDIIKNIDIYKYNLKSEGNSTKKHIGFVIGDKYNYSKEITSTENDGADIYSFVSVCCKAIQEQQEEIEMLKDRINKLEKGENNG